MPDKRELRQLADASEPQQEAMDDMNPTVEEARQRADEHEALARKLRSEGDARIARAARRERWASRWRAWANEKERRNAEALREIGMEVLDA